MTFSSYILIMVCLVVSFLAGYFAHKGIKKCYNDGLLYVLKARDDKNVPPSLYVKLNASPDQIRNLRDVHLIARVKYLNKEDLQDDQL